MGLGVIIAAGEDNGLIDPDLFDCITEVRVEQSLDDTTRFAIRFQEDIEDGEPRIRQAPELQTEQMIAIAVDVGDEKKCLVRGPIVEVKASSAIGGPGSWYEVRGRDRRIEMNRVCQRRAWVGRASEVASSIFGAYGFTAEIQETPRVYETNTGTLNQRASDLDFITRLARTNNLSFWLSYDCSSGGPAGLGDLNPLAAATLNIEEIAHFTSSPERPEGGLNLPLPQIPLVASTDAVLRVNVELDKCQNVSRFELNIDAERPNQFTGRAVDDRSVQSQDTTATDRQPPVFQGGQPLPAVAPSERTLCLATAGNHEELQTRSEAALTEAGWFATATASTTYHMLGDVLQPHDIIPVEGLGSRDSGDYQIMSVTHVINAADHHMELQLRRNAVGN